MADYQLIETMRCDKRVFFLLDLHIRRLILSAQKLGFSINLPDILVKLNNKRKALKKNKTYMVRLLLSRNGSLRIKTKLKPEIRNDLISFSKRHTSSKNKLLFYKTTRRDLYNSELKKARKLGLRDVVFVNEKGQVTEACVANVLIKTKGIFYTPPRRCGLLPGVFREHMLRSKKYKVREKVLHKEDLLKAKEVYLANSVSGLFKVSFPVKGK